MKKLWSLLLTLVLILSCLPAALADDAGALSVEEYSAWIRELLEQTVGVLALNAPVGEESLTDDGYAFLYEHMTLYYDKPELDASSRLQAAVLTDGTLASPRGIRVGDTLQDLAELYAWLNPDMYLVDGIASLYAQDALPDSAGWAWAQGAEKGITSLQCAVHSLVGEGLYTDAGVIYTLEDDVITGIRAYGVNQTITRADVESNLAAVRGEVAPQPAEAVHAYAFAASEAAAFSAEDLSFAGLRYATLTEQTAQDALGAPASEEWVEDDTGDWLHIVTREGVVITHVLDPLRTLSRPDSVVITGAGVQGPRGVTVGMSLEQVTALFACDGQNASLGNATLLYGDGDLPPYGLCEPTSDGAVLRYATEIPAGIGKTSVICLRLSFDEASLTEITVYTLY